MFFPDFVPVSMLVLSFVPVGMCVLSLIVPMGM